MGCCCQLQPVHESHSSTIIFDSGLLYCGPNPRLAKGEPKSNICSRADYEAVAVAATHLGMKERICFEANCFGKPCCGHGWPLDGYAQDLNGQFPHLMITINDSYQGCDDQGHWEFIITIQKRSEPSTGASGAVKAEVIQRDVVTKEEGKY